MEYLRSKIINIKYYWYAWIGAVVLLFALRFLLIQNVSDGAKFSLFHYYSLFTWIPLIGIGFYHGKKFRNYLNENHPVIFKKYFSHAFGMITVDDPIGLLKFGLSKELYDDEDLNRLKKFHKGFFYLVLVMFTTMPVISFTIMV